MTIQLGKAESVEAATAGLPLSAQQASYSKFLESRKQVEAKLSKVRHRIGVYSGKGGVGKTTIAINLAKALQQNGFKVGLFDADMDCPNLHLLLGIDAAASDADQLRIPAEKDGLKAVSMGFIESSKEKASIWRGPILSSAIIQLLSIVEWGELDYLIIDFPPGTSDAPLTIMQQVTLDGFVIVTQPQAVAVNDAVKSANMARELGISILGIIENMSGEVFGSGGGEQAAKNLGVSFLGRVPLDSSIRECGELGEIATEVIPNYGELFGKIAEKLIAGHTKV